MNQLIIDHFNAIEEWLLQSSVVLDYKILKRVIAPADGKIRIKVVFTDESLVEIFEYVSISERGLTLSKYSFHWQDQDGRLKCRWDNAPHHPELSGAPQHQHLSEQSVVSVITIPDIFIVFDEMEKRLFK